METALPKVIYTCTECAMPVIMLDGNIIRACEHKEAGVAAEMSATCYGESELCE
jgi:hypothetical protein